MKVLISFLFICLVLSKTFAQVEQEEGFKLVKAEYLFGTERFEDAIKELNDIIKVNPTFKNALLLRGETKYKLAAYKGSKDDAVKYIESNGITMEVAALLGKSEFQIGNQDASLNSLSAAIALQTKDVKVYEMRAQIYTSKNMPLKACQDWEAAARLGSTTAAINAKKCGFSETKKTEPEKPKPSTDDNETTDVGKEPSDSNSENTKTEEKNNPTDTKIDTLIQDDIETKVVEEDNTKIPEEDDTKNRFVIDEDLSISIYGQGLGKRKVLEQPSILILSEENGTVAVEFCVNENGKVDYAEFNSQKSTLTKKSLVSLAIRKAKEFWFEKSDYPKQCGYILFEIKGS